MLLYPVLTIWRTSTITSCFNGNICKIVQHILVSGNKYMSDTIKRTRPIFLSLKSVKFTQQIYSSTHCIDLIEINFYQIFYLYVIKMNPLQ